MRGLHAFATTVIIALTLLAPNHALGSARRARIAQRSSAHPRGLVRAGVRPPSEAIPRTPPLGSSRPLRLTSSSTVPGFTRVLRVATAPNIHRPVVLVHLPPGFDPRGPLHAVVFLHGWLGCIDVVAQGTDAPCRTGRPARRAMDVIAQFDRAQVNAILVIPQLAYDIQSSTAGRLDQPGAFRAMLSEVLAHPDLIGPLHGARSVTELADVILVAHSGAYLAATAVLSVGGVDVRQVLLLDALYQRQWLFERWARDHLDGFESAPEARRLFVLFTPPSRTGVRCRALVSRIARALPAAQRHDALYVAAADDATDDTAFTRPLVSVGTTVRHGELPRRFLMPLLASAGLPAVRDISVAAAHRVISDDAHRLEGAP